MLFLRFLGWGLLFVVVLIFIGVFSYNFWLAVRADVFELPSYGDLDSESLSYWSDRMERDISYVGEMNVSAIRKSARLRVLVNRQLEIASEMKSYYDRNYAILSIALTLTKHDLDVNIDRTLRTMNENYESYAIRARIYISIALMQVRQKNLIGAMSAYSEYKRLVNHADLKLDMPENEESFIGAVTVLHLVQNIEELSDLFRIQIEFSRRINSGQRMRAYRLIAVEQSRSGSFLPNALNTLKMIHDTTEISRAVQLVVTFVARSPKIEPVEPTHSVPRDEGPWETIRSTLVVRNTIDSILQIIIKEIPDLDEQLSILRRIAGSVLMCDPDVYKVFRSAVQDVPNLESAVKTPVLKLLDNPVSDKIRAELKMPPRPKRKAKNNGEGIHAIDPAKHDWVDDKDMIDIQITTIDADTLKSIDVRQYSRILSAAATSYLQVNRTTDAAVTLQKAFNSAINQTDQPEQIRSLITIAGLQFDAGTIDDALKTLKILNQKLTAQVQPENNNTDNTADLTAGGLVDEQIFNVVELQVIGHYFEDAGQTVMQIKSIPLRDAGLSLIANELLRTDQLDNTAKIIENISDAAIKKEYQHRLAIAQAESRVPINSAVSIVLPAESLDVVGMSNPVAAADDDGIARCVSQLIRFGFFESAVITAKRVADTKLRSKLLAQAGREYVLIFGSYSQPNNRNQLVSERAFNNAVIVSEIISDTEQRIIFTLTIINAVLANKRYDKDSGLLQWLFESVLRDVDRIGKHTANVEDKIDINDNKSNLDKNNVGENNVGGVGLVAAGDSLRQLRGEIFSLVLLARVNLERLRIGEENIRNENVDEIWGDKLSELSERVISELGGEELTFSKVRGLANVSLVFLRCGKLREAAEAVKTAEAAANKLSDRSHVISILVNLMPVYKSLNDLESLARVRNRAIELAASFVRAGVDVRNVNIAWRTRDIELDRVMRKLVELGMIDDVVSAAENINEPIIYDRVMRAIVYILLDKNDCNSAESIAKKLRLDEYRFAAIRDTNFIKNITVENKE
ncbi:MAG: hypothetical protein LBT09_14965 [Planctomycetaceae bacterium]|nr:hypothetical protein [Planctomycetaceae bacterium]